MSSQGYDYQATLNKMAELQDLVATVDTTSKTLSTNRANLMKLITDCNNIVQSLQANIDQIKGQGAQAQAQVKDLIKSASERQQSTLNKLKASINAMGNTSDLEKQLNLLKTDLNKIASGINNAGASGPPGGASGSTGGPAAPSSYIDAAKRGASRGGYTYGKSRRGRGNRRRRTKKSRRKGKR